MELVLTPSRRVRVLTLGLAASISLYVLMVFVAEPLRSLAATDNTTVTLQVTSAIALSCTQDVTLPPAPGSGTSGSGTTVLGYCTPITSNALGYTLGWRVVTGSGSPALGCSNAAPCFGTGHMLSNNVTGGYPDAILAFDRKGDKVNVPGDFDGDTIKTGSGARWAARLMATSTTAAGGDITWGADGAHEGFLNVATGAIVNIARRNTETAPTGDTEVIKYKVYIPTGAFQPSGTYKVTVQFTATDN